MPSNRSGLMCEEFIEIQKSARKDMADLYRKIRAKHPPMARLLYRRTKEYERQTMNYILYGEPNLAVH